MRHIDISGQQPDAAWLATAAELAQRFRDLPTDEERRRFLRDNRNRHWEALGPWLRDRFHGKCWYGERKHKRCGDAHQEAVPVDGRVEHYRPVEDSDGGAGLYAFLAYEWSNCRYVWSEIQDDLMKRRCRDSFPLRRGSPRAQALHELVREEPELLDPCNKDDVELVTFSETGRIMPSESNSGLWSHRRAKSTIKRFKLNYHKLTKERQVIWHKATAAAREVVSEHSNGNDRGWNTVVGRLLEMCWRGAEYSATALAAARKVFIVEGGNRSWETLRAMAESDDPLTRSTA